MTAEVCIVIPFYKSTLTAYEQISLRRCGEVLAKHPLVAIVPMGMKLPDVEDIISFTSVEEFENRYFEGIKGYNSLMMSSVFYQRFINYKYILIYQLDCFVFKDELLYWCKLNYDYVGAPWIPVLYKKNRIQLIAKRIENFFDLKKYRQNNDVPNEYQFKYRVGNGGFSLRKVEKFYQITTLMKPVIDEYLGNESNVYNEDVFWSIEVNREKRILNIPTVELALKFAFEAPPCKVEQLKELPFGCHDWDFHKAYWQQIFDKLGYQI